MKDNVKPCRRMVPLLIVLAAVGSDPAATASGPGRVKPATTSFQALSSPGLASRAVPLPQLAGLADANFPSRQMGPTGLGSGRALRFNPGIVLVKFRQQRHVAALGVEPGREREALRVLGGRADVEFAELDRLQERQFVPNDSQVTHQWHHRVIRSFEAWERTLGEPSVRVAVVDTPFQMDHPDLAANTDSGWDVVNGGPVLTDAGIAHSTLCAGMVAAVVNNGLGVAGAGNCRVLPINIEGATSEMYHAIIWAADHGVRVVNISWTGGDSDTLNEAGRYLKATAGGILIMAGVNGVGLLDYLDQPDIYCISMTDAAENLRSHFGPHIDFALPGWDILSTTIGSGYGGDSGTSYATALFSGIVAVLFGVNPLLSPEETIAILQATSVDLGPPGRDPYFGWGRPNFGAAVEAAVETLPAISGIVRGGGLVTVTTELRPGRVYTLWRTPRLEPHTWFRVSDVRFSTNGTALSMTDLSPEGDSAFYRVQIGAP